MAVHLLSPYHPNQRPWECCFPLGSLFPTASHLKVAPDACAGRLLMMEQALMVGEDPLFQDFENLFVGIIMGATLIHEFLEPAYFKNCFKES